MMKWQYVITILIFLEGNGSTSFIAGQPVKVERITRCHETLNIFEDQLRGTAMLISEQGQFYITIGDLMILELTDSFATEL